MKYNVNETVRQSVVEKRGEENVAKYKNACQEL